MRYYCRCRKFVMSVSLVVNLWQFKFLEILETKDVCEDRKKANHSILYRYDITLFNCSRERQKV